MNVPDLSATVLGFLLEGNSERDIKEWLIAKGENADHVYTQATASLRTAHQRAMPHNRAFCLEGMREMYRRLVEIGDYAAASKVLVDLNKLANQ